MIQIIKTTFENNQIWIINFNQLIHIQYVCLNYN
jgi:hypothetical protein